jgi:hypothetical protein
MRNDSQKEIKRAMGSSVTFWEQRYETILESLVIITYVKSFFQIILSIPVVLDLSNSTYAPLTSLLSDSLVIEQTAQEIFLEIKNKYDFDPSLEHSKAVLDMYIALIVTSKGIHNGDNRYNPIRNLVFQKMYNLPPVLVDSNPMSQ